tara:strand:- start:680 stop:1723 length:1044 start_codon:yes stop_codon:yes gene_type:complete
MIHIDGNYLEGGGQIVRTALSLSAYTGEGFTVTEIRKGRDKPGLKAQHLHGVKALQELCNAKVGDAHMGSERLTFIPEKFSPKTISLDIGTAGSITLLLQGVLLPCLFGEKGMRLKLVGGTDVNWSPSFDYFDKVIVPQLRRYADLDVGLERRGYYPKGQGKVDIKIKPKKLDHIPKLHLVEQGALAKVDGIVHVSQALAEKQVGERMAQSAKMHLGGLEVPKEIKIEYVDSSSIGTGITLVGKYSSDDSFTDEFNPVILGVDRLGEKNITAEEIGKQCALSLLDAHNSAAPVDKHLGDMLIPFLGLFGGEIHVEEITNHLKTNIYVVEKFLKKKFKIDERNKVISL